MDPPAVKQIESLKQELAAESDQREVLEVALAELQQQQRLHGKTQGETEQRVRDECARQHREEMAAMRSELNALREHAQAEVSRAKEAVIKLQVQLETERVGDTRIHTQHTHTRHTHTHTHPRT